MIYLLFSNRNRLDIFRTENHFLLSQWLQYKTNRTMIFSWERIINKKVCSQYNLDLLYNNMCLLHFRTRSQVFPETAVENGILFNAIEVCRKINKVTKHCLTWNIICVFRTSSEIGRNHLGWLFFLSFLSV